MLEPIFREFKKQKYEVYIFEKHLTLIRLKLFLFFLQSV